MYWCHATYHWRPQTIQANWIQASRHIIINTYNVQRHMKILNGEGSLCQICTSVSVLVLQYIIELYYYYIIVLHCVMRLEHIYLHHINTILSDWLIGSLFMLLTTGEAARLFTGQILNGTSTNNFQRAVISLKVKYV